RCPGWKAVRRRLRPHNPKAAAANGHTAGGGCGMGKIVLYHSITSRAFVPLWLLYELGVPFEIADTDIRAGKQKAPEYLKLNPMGKVPTLVDDGVVVTEIPAICLYLA